MGIALVLSAASVLDLAENARLHIVATDAPEAGARLVAAGRLPRLAVGTTLTPPAGSPVLQIVGVASIVSMDTFTPRFTT